jgi:acyl-CoA ligase (AMP-forming) (exosortase A-associated)
MNHLIHHSIFDSAARTPDAEALVYGARRLNYAQLAGELDAFAAAVLAQGLAAGDRVAVYMEKRIENVAALFGAAAAGCVFVPVNPLLKPEQVAYILADCNVRLLVTTPERLAALRPVLAACPDLQAVMLTGPDKSDAAALPALLAWPSTASEKIAGHRRIDTDVAAILYTSGSTGAPKGVVLSHRNMVAGADSVASYLGMRADERILAVLPLSFDYGLSQLSTAFLTGACAVLINHLFARDIVAMVEQERITGLAAVPPLWISLAALAWPAACTLRFITNSGGAMPVPTVQALQQALPSTRIFLMYGLTEAFRSTYLAPEQVSVRPGSIGQAIPNAEILVVRADGSICDVDEPGELVHRGPLVALGYWNDRERTAQRFRAAPGQHPALPVTELAVWSGDTVRRDADGFLYFIGRGDDMIKVSGYRISPTEIEAVLHATGLVTEAAAFGIEHPTLGQAIAVIAVAADASSVDAPTLLAECKRRLPAYMVPAQVELRAGSLPRNPNGKIDRNLLRQTLRMKTAS